MSVCRLRIAFKWIVRSFSGYLSTDQLLILWDRILGYDSLEIVAGTYSHVFYAPSFFLSFCLTLFFFFVCCLQSLQQLFLPSGRKTWWRSRHRPQLRYASSETSFAALPIWTTSKATCFHPSSSQEEDVHYTVKMPITHPSSQRGRTYHNTVS